MGDLQKVGTDWGGLGTFKPLTAGPSGNQRVGDAHGRFMDAAWEGRLFSWGKTVTALSANSITLTATTTPIIGVWNPLTSKKYLVILQASLQLAVAGNSAVAPGGFVWAASIGNGAISTGNNPWDRRDLQQTGSVAKGFDLATALTGLTNNLVIFDSADTGSLVAAQGATASPLFSAPAVQNFDGSLIVPPGGMLALLNTTSTTTVSAAARLLWEEIPFSVMI